MLRFMCLALNLRCTVCKMFHYYIVFLKPQISRLQKMNALDPRKKNILKLLNVQKVNLFDVWYCHCWNIYISGSLVVSLEDLEEFIYCRKNFFFQNCSLTIKCQAQSKRTLVLSVIRNSWPPPKFSRYCYRGVP